MSTEQYRLVEIGSFNPDAVTVGVEAGADGTIKAAVWWESKGDVDADELEFTSVADALAAAEASRALHGFGEVVVVLARPELWDPHWGTLRPIVAREPIEDISAVDRRSRTRRLEQCQRRPHPVRSVQT